MTNKTIAERYCEILSELPPEYLLKDKHGGLSHPFLVNGPEDPSASKIMVIGRECGANWWVKGYKDEGVRTYVDEALAHHKRRFKKWMDDRALGSGATFFGFMQNLERKLGTRRGLIYSNLFCFDYSGADPRGAKGHYERVVEPFSRRLLNAQIEHFEPNLIIFANGIDSASIRRKFFPHVDGVVQGKRWSGLDQVIPNNQLWEFQLHGKYRCLRIQHPAVYTKAARAARTYLIDHLPQFLEAPL